LLSTNVNLSSLVFSRFLGWETDDLLLFSVREGHKFSIAAMVMAEQARVSNTGLPFGVLMGKNGLPLTKPKHGGTLPEEPHVV
jgi:hypothetical protein